MQIILLTIKYIKKILQKIQFNPLPLNEQEETNYLTDEPTVINNYYGNVYSDDYYYSRRFRFVYPNLLL